MHGTSFAYTFDGAKAAERHTQQYFEILAIARCIKTAGLRVVSSVAYRGIGPDGLGEFCAAFGPGKDVWELYNTTEDFSQANDLAQKFPEK